MEGFPSIWKSRKRDRAESKCNGKKQNGRHPVRRSRPDRIKEADYVKIQ